MTRRPERTNTVEIDIEETPVLEVALVIECRQAIRPSCRLGFLDAIRQRTPPADARNLQLGSAGERP